MFGIEIRYFCSFKKISLPQLFKMLIYTRYKVNLPKFEADLSIDLKMSLVYVSGCVSPCNDVLDSTYCIYVKYGS